MYSAVYGTVHYKEHLKSFEIRVGHPGFGLASVAIGPIASMCKRRRKAISTHSPFQKITKVVLSVLTESRQHEQ